MALLDIEELEGLEAPGFWSFVGGFAVGVAVVGAGTAIGIAIT
ncbi:daptide-type RiPP [Frankia sp. Cppng1_Ct_nod]|nr:daptide-type RiPP [Frankia sp. Cppng1_Ct_nod]